MEAQIARQAVVSYRDGIAAIGAEIDSMELAVPESQRMLFEKLKVALDEALAGADGLAQDAGATPSPLPSDLDKGLREFYGHLAANLRWPPGYATAHKRAIVHQMLGSPANEDEARERAA